MRPDFSRIWGSDNAPFTPIEASDYTAGWVFRTGAPPRRVNFDYFQNLSDQRAAWLGEQMLLAVGHEWQDDVSYDAYAITRSPADGQLYRSLVGGNLGSEPSVSGAQWALGVYSVADASETVKGVVELATDEETVSGLLRTFAVHPAGLLAALTAFLPKRAFTANDYIRIPDVPGGLIIQWGNIAYMSAQASSLVTLPIAFPTQFFGAFTTAVQADAGGDEWATFKPNNLASFYVQRASNSGTTPGGAVYWLAVGC